MFTTPGSRVATKKKPITAIATSGNGLTISTSFFTADQRNSARKKLLIVPAGVTLGAPVTGVMNGALEIIVLGNVDGLGGAAATTTAAPGGNGGDAIRFDMDNVTVRVRGGGNLRGGGGGGGKGGDGSATTTQGPTYDHDGPAYYAWLDVNGSQRNIYWEAYSGPTYIIYDGSSSYAAPDGWTYHRDYYPGAYSGWNAIRRTQLSTTTSGAAGRGQGYDGAKTNGVAGGTNSGLSGNGGDWGSVGANGANGNAGSGSNAGSPGKAANLNSKLNCAVVNEGGTISGVAA